MHGAHTPLAHLKKGESGRIIHIHGGHGFKRRLNTLGIREGQIVKVVSKQPMVGPLTFSVGNCQMTMGRGMAHKIIVEGL
ncbi:MAG: ferrous iron transport protein A [Thermoplasmatales archaeon]|nr:ferrous iron transport protein A [Thermoplasmatales archaeon]